MKKRKSIQRDTYSYCKRLGQICFWLGMLFDILFGISILIYLFVQELKFVSLVSTGFSLFLALYFYTQWWKYRKKMEGFSRIESLENLNGRDFEHFMADFLKKRGFNSVRVVGGQSDRGVDLVAHKDGQKWIVQCKCYREGWSVKSPAMQQFVGSLQIAKGDRGLLVTTSHCTPDALAIAKEQGITVWDREWLAENI